MRIRNLGKFVVLLSMLIATLAVEASELINLSTRAYLGGDGPLVHGGVVLQEVYGPKMIVIRVRGPSLPIPDKMPDPALRVFNDQRVLIDHNDDWMTHPSAPILVENGLAPTDPLEPAMALSVLPGRYMVVANSADGASGEIVISVTDMEPLEPLRVINLSTRAYVDNAQALVHGGLVIQGVGREHVVVRVKGPSLPLADAMSDPLLQVYDSVPRVIDANNDWMDHETAALMEEVGLAPPDPREPAVALSLLPGRYTAVVEAADGHAGETVVSATEIPGGTVFDYWETCAGFDIAPTPLGSGESAGGVLSAAAQVQNDVPTFPTNDLYLAKFARDGQLLWADVLPHPQFGFSSLTNDIQPTKDGSFLATGVTTTHLPDDCGEEGVEGDVFLAKIDAAGRIDWARRFPMACYQSGHDVRPLDDGGFVIAGINRDPQNDRETCQVIRTDANAEIRWVRNFVPNDPAVSANCSVIEETMDGDFLLLGQTSEVHSYVYDYVVRLDADGNLLWEREYDLGDYWVSRHITDVREMQDGGVLFVGEGSFYFGLSDTLLPSVHVLGTDRRGIERWSDWISYPPPPPDGNSDSFHPPNVNSVRKGDPSILQIDARGFLIAAARLLMRRDFNRRHGFFKPYPDLFPGGPGIPVSDGTFFIVSDPELRNDNKADLCAMKIDIAQ
ncbi:MAG: hypothetical protein WBN68_10435 [Sedimenticolaceae bacterium]